MISITVIKLHVLFSTPEQCVPSFVKDLSEIRNLIRELVETRVRRGKRLGVKGVNGHVV